jgi:hypothetical protein
METERISINYNKTRILDSATNLRLKSFHFIIHVKKYLPVVDFPLNTFPLNKLQVKNIFIQCK